MSLSLTNTDVVHMRRCVAKILVGCSAGVHHNPHEIEALCSSLDQWVSIFPAHNTLALKQWGTCYCHQCVVDGACDTTWVQVYPIHASDELWPRVGSTVRWIHYNRRANGVHHAIQWSMTRNTSTLHLGCIRTRDVFSHTSAYSMAFLPYHAQLGVLMRQSPAPGSRTFYQDNPVVGSELATGTYVYTRCSETPVVYNLKRPADPGSENAAQDYVACSNRIVYSDRYMCVTQKSWVSRAGYTRSMTRCHEPTRFSVVPRYAVHIRIPL